METIREYYNLRKQLDKYTKDMRDVITHPNYALQFMQPGRVVRVKFMEHDFGWGVVVNFEKRKASRAELETLKPNELYVVDVLLHLSSNLSDHGQMSAKSGSNNLPSGVKPAAFEEVGRMEIVPVILSCIESIGHLRIFLPQDLKSSEQRNTVRKSLQEVKRRFPDGIALLDPIENMGIVDASFKQLIRVSKFGRLSQTRSNLRLENRSS